MRKMVLLEQNRHSLSQLEQQQRQLENNHLQALQQLRGEEAQLKDDIRNTAHANWRISRNTLSDEEHKKN